MLTIATEIFTSELFWFGLAVGCWAGLAAERWGRRGLERRKRSMDFEDFRAARMMQQDTSFMIDVTPLRVVK